MDRFDTRSRRQRGRQLADGSGLVQGDEGPRYGLGGQISSSEHSRVLAQALDVPAQAPAFGINLSEVGISGKTVWVHLPQGRLPFDAEISVDLSGRVRGIHMSRIEEAGFKTITLDVSEFQKLDGGLSCLSLRF